MSLPPEVSYYLGNDDFESLLNYESFNKLFPLDSSKPPPTNNHDNIVERLDPLIYYYTHTHIHTLLLNCTYFMHDGLTLLVNGHALLLLWTINELLYMLNTHTHTVHVSSFLHT